MADLTTTEIEQPEGTVPLADTEIVRHVNELISAVSFHLKSTLLPQVKETLATEDRGETPNITFQVGEDIYTLDYAHNTLNMTIYRERLGKEEKIWEKAVLQAPSAAYGPVTEPIISHQSRGVYPDDGKSPEFRNNSTALARTESLILRLRDTLDAKIPASVPSGP